jgi:hypothetical protein
MADLYGTVVAANARRIPATQELGTVGIRQLSFFSVTITGVHTNYTNANSLFAKAVLGAQTGAELFFVGTPAADAFVIAVATDTMDSSGPEDLTPTVAEQIKINVDTFTGETSTVVALTASGASIA